MKIKTIEPSELSGDEIAAWSAIQRRTPQLASPYFRPEFTQAVAAVRDTPNVAVMESAGEPIGFLPFGRTKWNTGIPVGSRLSDFHGVIAPANVTCDPLELVRCSGLSSWRFDHLVATHTAFRRHAWQMAESPYVDLAQGYDAYRETLKNRMVSELRRKRNAIERNVGPVRFEPHVNDPEVLKTLLDWKSQQYRRTGALDITRYPWVPKLLNITLQYQSDDFAAMMPVLYAGSEILAIAYLLRSHTVLHGWFTVYNVKYAKYSPGKQLFMDILRTAPELGVTRFDLGKGPEEYKASFRNGATVVAEGAIDRSLVRAGVRSAVRAVRNGVCATPLRDYAKRLGGAAYQFRGWLELQ